MAVAAILFPACIFAVLFWGGVFQIGANYHLKSVANSLKNAVDDNGQEFSRMEAECCISHFSL